MYQFAAEPLLPWSDTDNDRRFNSIAKKVFIIFFILFIVIPLLPTPEVKKESFDELPPRFARLLIKPPVVKPIIKKIEPKKIIKKKKKKDVKKKVKKKPKKVVKKAKPKPSAKKVAQSIFDSAGFDELADLRDGFDANSIKKSKKSNKRITKPKALNILTSDTGTGSGGISSTNAKFASNTQYTERKTTTVTDSIEPSSRSRSTKIRNTGWSTEEIQLTIQRKKGSIHTYYNRALRNNPGLQGTILFEITINASGKVTKIIILSSDLNNKKLESKIKLRIKSLNFGAKPSAKPFTFTYPLVLIPQ